MKNWELGKRKYLSLKYKYMRQRVQDVALRSRYSGPHYLGKPICTREEFIKFGMLDRTFAKLFKQYKRSKGKRVKAPSVDRKAWNRGYTLDNIQFLSVPDNSRKQALDKKISLLAPNGSVKRFYTPTAAGKYLGHRGRIKMNRSRYISLKTGEVFLNATRSKKSR